MSFCSSVRIIRSKQCGSLLIHKYIYTYCRSNFQKNLRQKALKYFFGVEENPFECATQTSVFTKGKHKGKERKLVTLWPHLKMFITATTN